jgi:hypothetical protein
VARLGAVEAVAEAGRDGALLVPERGALAVEREGAVDWLRAGADGAAWRVPTDWAARGAWAWRGLAVGRWAVAGGAVLLACGRDASPRGAEEARAAVLAPLSGRVVAARAGADPWLLF